MMKPLRKRHLQIWKAWAILLPAGILFAWLAIPDQRPVKLLQPESKELLPLIKDSIISNAYTVVLRSDNESTTWQLEWKNNSVLTVPSAVIYKVNETTADIEKNELVGRIEARGDYVFSLNNDSSTTKDFRFILYDFIHQKIIDSINFKTPL